MTDPAITCPNCRHESKLTESLSAPLIAATRAQYEAKLAAKDAEIGTREAALRAQQADLATARKAIADEVAKGVEAGRLQLAAEEAAKARRLVQQEIEQNGKALDELNAVLKDRTRSSPKPRKRKPIS